MKYSVLDMVQSIASSMDSDEINSIGDSPEALQIANVIKTAYFDMIGRANLPVHYSLINLDASLDANKPVLMSVPDTIEKIEWVKYNKMAAVSDPINMELVNYLTLEDFLNRMYSLDTTESNVGSFLHTVGSDAFTIIYQNDMQPNYYTTFDDNTLIFDAYNAAIDTTLQKSKTQCYGKKVIPFTLSDTFVPDLDEDQFPLLLNEAKSLAWLELKQTQHAIAERNSRRNWNQLRKTKFSTEHQSDFDQLPYFGRK